MAPILLSSLIPGHFSCDFVVLPVKDLKSISPPRFCIRPYNFCWLMEEQQNLGVQCLDKLFYNWAYSLTLLPSS